MSGLVETDNILRFRTEGADLLDNVLPVEVANAICAEFSDATWDQRHDQVRPDHYKHVFATDSEYLPGPDEAYLARFDRSTKLEASLSIRAAIDAHIVPLLKAYIDSDIDKVEIRCIAMGPGDFMRCHVDDYMGKIGFIYYANTYWGMDWGGLLAVAGDDDVRVIVPRFNRMAVVSHTENRIPHFVTPVADYAFERRFAVAAFCG